MQFSLDCKQRNHQRTRYSAFDSVGLIFTRSYRSSLLITTPTTTPSLVKTSLKECISLSPNPNSYQLLLAFVVELLHSKADQMDTKCEQFHAVNLHEEKGKEIEGIT